MSVSKGRRRAGWYVLWTVLGAILLVWPVVWFGFLLPPDGPVMGILCVGLLPHVLFVCHLMDVATNRRWPAKIDPNPWREVCPLIGDEHSHDGRVLHLTWHGRPFKAVAVNCYQPQGMSERFYSLSTPVAERRAPWRLEWWATDWRMRTDDVRVEQQLQPLLLPAMAETQHHRAGVRLSHDPTRGIVAYGDDSGAVPPPDDFLAHLRLLHRAASLCDSWEPRPALPPAEPRLRVWLRFTEAPTWVLGLFFPACIVGLIGLDTSSWFFVLLPIALVMPYAWRVRIGRR